MARRRREPTWLGRVVIDAIHNDQLREHGGLPGVRDENVLESALARPQQKWNYGEGDGIPGLAAAYAFGLIRNHPYRDGNKRIGLLAMATFLGLNGYELTATEAEAVEAMLALAAGVTTETSLVAWVEAHSRKTSSGSR